MARSVIDPVTRIEGHLRVEMEVENGVVSDAWVSGGCFRGMELVVKDRTPEDAAHIVQRICGVCPVSHSHAATIAAEKAYGITISNNARIIRNLIEGAQFLHSHILWFYTLAALDYVNPLNALKANVGSAYDLVEAAGTSCQSDLKALQERLAKFAENGQLSIFSGNWFDAEDGEGDSLTFQLTSTPARGAVTVAEDGSSQFVYTPYENKTGKDSFTYVAVDPAGNVSPEAKVSIQIEKPDTKVTYADMEGNPAHKASIRLAEEGIFVGSYVNGSYFFDPDQPVSRAEFLTMAMAATGLEPLEDVTLTGFYDDEAIPTWAKGYVSSALKAGAIQGSLDQEGQPVFGSGETVTQGEATVMLDNLMGILDVPAEVFASESGGHWAGQAAANLSASGVIHGGDDSAQAMADPLTRADVAELLDGAMDVMADQDGSIWFSWS